MKIVITIAPLIECSVDGAGVRIKANLDGSVDVTALAADYEHAQEPAEAPDAGEANPMPRTTAFAQGALDAIAAEQAAKPKVYRHDEHMPAGGPRVTRIETEGERG